MTMYNLKFFLWSKTNKMTKSFNTKKKIRIKCANDKVQAYNLQFFQW